MNSDQNRLYWFEFNAAWKARCQLGGAPADREAWRKFLHLRAACVDRAGQPKSSTAFTNRDLDRFVGTCRAYSDGGNLAAQLAIEDQPTVRLMLACGPFLDALQVAEDKRRAYVAGVYHNVQRKRARESGREFGLDDMPEADVGLVLAALKHSAEHRTATEHEHPRTRYAGGRARYFHRVGSRKNAAESGAEITKEIGSGAANSETAQPSGNHF